MSFNIDSVRKMTMKPNALKAQSFVHIYEKVTKLIENRASQGHFEIRYTIPCFVIGYPPYNCLDCASFLYYKFKEQQFEVVIEPILSQQQQVSLKISWRSPPKHPLQPAQSNTLESAKPKAVPPPRTYNYVSSKINEEDESAAQQSRKGKKNTTYRIKEAKTAQPATMNFLHNTGVVDEIPVNPKSSIYL
jgi:hypothetical protein